MTFLPPLGTVARGEGAPIRRQQMQNKKTPKTERQSLKMRKNQRASSASNGSISSPGGGSGSALSPRGTIRAAQEKAMPGINRISVRTRRVFAVDLSTRVGDVIPLLCKQFNHQKEPSVWSLIDTENKKVLNPGRTLASQGVNDATPLELVESELIPEDYARARDFATRKSSFATLRLEKAPDNPEETKHMIETIREDAHHRAHAPPPPLRAATLHGLPREHSGSGSMVPASEDRHSAPKTMRRKESRAVLKPLKSSDDLAPEDISVYVFARNQDVNVRISPSSSYVALVKAVMKERKVKGDPGDFGIWLQELDSDSEAVLSGGWAYGDHPINSADLKTQRLVFLKKVRKAIVKLSEGNEVTETYDSSTSVSDLFRSVTGRELAPSHDLAIFLPEGEIMDRDRLLWSFRISGPLVVKMKERKIVVFLREGNQKTFQVDYSRTVFDLMEEFCHAFGVPDPENYFMITLRGKETPLLGAKSLVDQDVSSPASVFLKPKKKRPAPARPRADSSSSEYGRNFWDEVQMTTKEETMEFGKPKDGQPQLIAASLNRLLERLTSENAADHDLVFAGTFLLTYQSFTTTQVLLHKLKERYSVPVDFPLERRQFIQMRVLSVLLLWLEKHYAQDFGHDMMEGLVSWIDERVVPDSYDLLANKLRHAIVQRTCGLKRDKLAGLTIGRKIPEPMIPKDAQTLWDYPMEEVARQITLIDFDYYFEIKPQELLNQNWNKKKELAPNIETQISRMNHLGMWATNSILEPESPSGRARRWVKLIELASYLRALHNFNTIAALLGGMQNASINRLNKTISKMPKQKLEEMQDLNVLMSPNGSYKSLRAALASSSLPCIPFLGMYLRDLTFIEDGNQDMLRGLINFEKRSFLHNIIAEVQKYQQISYSFIRVQKLADNFIWLPNLSDKILYDISLVREPRAK